MERQTRYGWSVDFSSRDGCERLEENDVTPAHREGGLVEKMYSIEYER